MDDDTKLDMMIALTVSLSALFFATVLTLMAAKYHKQFRKWLSKHFQWLNKPASKDLYDLQEEQRKYVKSPKSGVKKQSPKSKLKSVSILDSSFPPLFMPSKEMEFSIPGSTQHEIQPLLKERYDFEFNETSSHSPPSSGPHTPTSTGSGSPVLLAKSRKQIRKWLSNNLPWHNKSAEQDQHIKEQRLNKVSKLKTRVKKRSKPSLKRTSRNLSAGEIDSSFLPDYLEEMECPISVSTEYQVQPIITKEHHFTFMDIETDSPTPTSSCSDSPCTTPINSTRSAPVSPSLLRKALSMQVLPKSGSLDSLNEGLPKSMRRVSLTEQRQTNDNLLQPELYFANRRGTCGMGNLGKIRFSLQFMDNSRKKLYLLLHRLEKLQFIGPEITAIYVKVVLLPERETIYHTKQQETMTSLAFDEKFVFNSRPLNRDFEAKTIRFVAIYIDKASKEVPYGEARMPLLSREIYSQIQTDVSLNIKPIPKATESGDLLIQLAYAPDSGTLTIILKTLRFLSSAHSENMSGIQIKSYVKRPGEKHGRKYHNVSRPIIHDGSVYINIAEQYNYKIVQEQFKETYLQFTVLGKHKILGRSFSLGKAIIGESSRDETGAVHWRNICSSPGLAWSVWHPIYS